MTTPGSLDLKGIYTALVTPFTKDGSALDKDSLARLVDAQIAAGVSGVVACGSTGEAATLSDKEYAEVVSFVRERTKGKLPCVAGISVSATARAVEVGRLASEIGCDGVLVATPPYNKPSQQGIAEHLKAVKAASGLPVIAYNIPGRSGVAISAATLGQLSREGVIVGVKESSGSVDAVADILNAVQSDCQVVSGEDSLLLAVLAYGGTGAIAAGSNALPKEFVALYDAFTAGDARNARNIQLSLLARIRSLFVECNPVPVKTVLALQGVIAHPTVRLPLTPLTPASLERVTKEFSL